jgi:hypothetical protein
LVDQETVADGQRGKDPISIEWDRRELVGRLTGIVRRKDTAASSPGGAYAEYLLVVHTDEPELHIEALESHLDGFELPATQQITRVYMLVSFDPRTRSYPWLRIPIVAG